ncbi:MAG: hypothetical protein FWD23_09450 [Oscillospiraceae bacterium]|nr:hypothetical protein [Oscillospiraceae bacterium]
MPKKPFVFALCAIACALVLLAFASCGGDDLPGAAPAGTEESAAEPEQSSSAEPGMSAPVVPDRLPKGDYGGYEFRVMTRDTAHHSVYIDAENENGEYINDAVYRRNRIIEDLYNIRIKSIQFLEFDGPGGYLYPFNELMKTVKAGSDEYDLAMIHMINAGVLASGKYLIDWKEIPHLDLGQPWWDQGVTDGLMINGKLYLNSGDFNLDCTDFTWGMIFNKKLWQDFGFEEDIYETVKSGKWTLERFGGIIKQSTRDINGDGIFDENDQYGFIAIDRGGLTNFMFGSGERVYKKNDSGGFDLVLKSERMQTAVERTYDIYWNNNSSYVFREPPGKYLPEDEPMDMFMENKGLLASARLAAMPVLRGMEIDFGIIPQPKFDEAQSEYCTFSDGHASMMCIPATMPDTDLFGVVMEALAYTSRSIVLPAYYDVSLTTKFTRDDQSSEMIDIIIKNRIFDVGYVYNDSTGNLGFIINELIQAKKTDFTSAIERKEAAASKALEKLIDSFE